MKTNIDRINERAEAEKSEILRWQVALNNLEEMLEEKVEEIGEINVKKNRMIIDIARNTVCYDPDYWSKVNSIIKPIYEELKLINDMGDENGDEN